MIKKSLLTLAAIAALTSCSQDDLMNNTEKHESGAIGVNVFVPTSSRGVAFDDVTDFQTSDAGKTFDLFAIYSEQNNNIMFMGAPTDGVEFNYVNGWDYKDKSEMRFWKEAEGKELTFYAVAPANHHNLKKEVFPTPPKFTYTVSDTCSSQVDLMYATTVADCTTSTDAYKNGITLNFKHALSQILFKAKTEHSKLYADIRYAQIKDVAKKGTFTIGDTPAWTLESEKSSYEASLMNKTGITSAGATLSNKSNALLLLPQTLNGTTLNVNCAIYYKEGESPDVTPIKVFDGTINVALTGEWKAGYKYTYTLIFSNELANPIKIGSVTVDTWENGGDNNTSLNNSNS